ncbi:MAG: hypothetical protein U0X20_07980 [Caldilineaceae bacterium]
MLWDDQDEVDSEQMDLSCGGGEAKLYDLDLVVHVEGPHRMIRSIRRLIARIRNAKGVTKTDAIAMIFMAGVDVLLKRAEDSAYPGIAQLYLDDLKREERVDKLPKFYKVLREMQKDGASPEDLAKWCQSHQKDPNLFGIPNPCRPKSQTEKMELALFCLLQPERAYRLAEIDKGFVDFGVYPGKKEDELAWKTGYDLLRRALDKLCEQPGYGKYQLKSA